MRLILAGLVLACILASCSNDNPVVIEDDIPYVAPARVVAVTLPESLVAGADVPVLVHWWKRHCTEQVDRFDRVQVGARHWTITPVTHRFPTHACTTGDECVSFPDSFMVQVPASGVDSYTVVGFGGSIDMEVTAGIGASDAGHRLLLLDRATSSPLAGAEYTFRDWVVGVVATMTTDAGGAARVSPTPCASVDAPMDLVISGSNCGEGALRFQHGSGLCGRALRTTMLYGPFPSEPVAIPATPAM